MTLITNANLENDEPRRHAQEIHPVFFLVRWISSASRRQVVPMHNDQLCRDPHLQNYN